MNPPRDSKLREGPTIGVGYAAHFPCMDALGRDAKLDADDGFADFLDQRSVGVTSFAHSLPYQRTVDRSSVHSLIATNNTVAHICARMELAQRIVFAYTALGISQAEAARRCGMSAQRFGNYVKGNRVPDVSSLITIAEALQTTPDQLLGVSVGGDAALTDILSRLLELEGVASDRARTIAEAVSVTHQVLKALPGEKDDPDRLRLAAQAVWTAQQSR